MLTKEFADKNWRVQAFFLKAYNLTQEKFFSSIVWIIWWKLSYELESLKSPKSTWDLILDTQHGFEKKMDHLLILFTVTPIARLLIWKIQGICLNRDQ